MEFGVRFGGAAPLPMTWRWGYGWAIDRGYEPLGVSEYAQIEKSYPKRFLISVETVPVLSMRQTITGDNCLDMALIEVQNIEQEDSFTYDVRSYETRSSAEGHIHSYQIDAGQCYQVELLTLKQNSCTNAMTELRARGQIRLKSLVKGCE